MEFVRAVALVEAACTFIDLSSQVVVGLSLGTGTPCNQVEFLRMKRSGADLAVDYKTYDDSGQTLCVPDVLPRVSFALVPAPVERVTFRRVGG